MSHRLLDIRLQTPFWLRLFADCSSSSAPRRRSFSNKPQLTGAARRRSDRRWFLDILGRTRPAASIFTAEQFSSSVTQDVFFDFDLVKIFVMRLGKGLAATAHIMLPRKAMSFPGIFWIV
jgi:hypothetical protein